MRVVSVPRQHAYVRNIAWPDDGIERIEVDAQRVRSSDVIDPAWVRAHAADFDCAHTHFGITDVDLVASQMRIAAGETLEDLGPNEEGEVVVSGPQVMRGYWKRPEADEEVFFEKDGKRFFRTGDIAVYDDACLDTCQ